jgi:hypothetical protein
MADYDVALSFSGEDRPVARRIAESLKNRGIQVLYDEYAQSELWGSDLYEHLQQIYEHSRLCIVLLSESYIGSQWKTVELRNLLAHSQSQDSFAILPVVLGNVDIRLPSNIAYFKWRDRDVAHLAALVEKQLRSLPIPARKVERESYHVIMREEGWSVKRGGASRAASVHKTREEAIAAARRTASKHRPSELVIHRKDGSIASKETIQADPRNADSAS